ncbi:MAG: TraR/DksA C4-type zinc finger protein [Gemmatimonadetes bacterium]|nr:TraR/DksA C4-type zinc finger protein [Gemmatimonadota bacterium]
MSTSALSPEQLAAIKDLLLGEQARAMRALGLFDQAARLDRESGDSDLTTYTDHMADQGTEAMEREKAAVMATKEGRYLYRLEGALRRLRESPNTFGLCHTCGKEVGYPRLEALPHARYCITCKTKEERG